MADNNYTSESIEVLSGLDPVRKRPGMYTDTTRPNHLAQEVIDNSVDEALAGHASKIEVTLYKDGSLEVVDDGRGMPVDIHPEKGLPGVEVIRHGCRLIAFYAVIHNKIHSGNPGHPGVETAISIQVKPAIARAGLVHGEILTVGHKLNTGGGHRHQADTLALGFEHLMHMPPDYAAHIIEAIYHFEERIGVAYNLLVQPFAAHGHRLMMKSNKHMLVATGRQGLFQEFQFGLGEIARHLTADGGIQHDDLPVTLINYTGAHITGHLVISHDVGEIVITGQPVYRAGKTRHGLMETGIGLTAAILRQITGSQYQVDIRLLRLDQIHHQTEALLGIQTQQLALCALKQVRIGKLDNTN